MSQDLDLSKLSKIGGFEWDEGNLEHIKKHHVEAKECEEAFFNKPLLVLKDEIHSQSEERLQALGLTKGGRMLFMVFALRSGKVRVISAKDQNKKERKIYQNGGEDEEAKKTSNVS